MPYLRFVAAVILILLLATFLTARGNKKPITQIISPAGGRVVFIGEPVAFQGEGKDPEGKSVSYRWDFADGTTSTSRDPTHSYLKSGKYQVRLVVNDGKLDSDAVTVLIVVKERLAQEEIIRISRITPLVMEVEIWVQSYPHTTARLDDLLNDPATRLADETLKAIMRRAVYAVEGGFVANFEAWFREEGITAETNPGDYADLMSASGRLTNLPGYGGIQAAIQRITLLDLSPQIHEPFYPYFQVDLLSKLINETTGQTADHKVVYDAIIANGGTDHWLAKAEFERVMEALSAAHREDLSEKITYEDFTLLAAAYEWAVFLAFNGGHYTFVILGREPVEIRTDPDEEALVAIRGEIAKNPSNLDAIMAKITTRLGKFIRMGISIVRGDQILSNTLTAEDLKVLLSAMPCLKAEIAHLRDDPEVLPNLERYAMIIGLLLTVA